MILSGLAKLTLLDYPGRTACTVFTGGCNFRCPFCHNALLVTGELASGGESEKEVFDHLEKRRGILDGVCITGGEPLIHADIADFIRRIRDLGYAVKLDTNGSFPDRLEDLVRGGLVDYVAVDIKNCREKYAMTVGLQNFDTAPVERTVDFLIHGDLPFEFRTTVVREFHEEDDFRRIGEWIAGTDRYFLQAFSDKGELIDGSLHGVPKEEMERFAAAAAPFVGSVGLRGV